MGTLALNPNSNGLLSRAYQSLNLIIIIQTGMNQLFDDHRNCSSFNLKTGPFKWTNQNAVTFFGAING